jgi:tetratricopeptide (TPR) repeat protein
MTQAIDDPQVPPATQLARATASALRGGDLNAALRHCQAALQLTRLADSASSTASVQTILGRVLLHRGQLKDANDILQRALDVHRATPTPHLIAATQLERASCLLAAGDVDAALSCGLEAVALYAKAGDAVHEARAQLGIAHAHHAAGRLNEARTHCAVAMKVAEADSDPSLRASCLERTAALDLEQGRRRQALRAYVAAGNDWHGIDDQPGQHRAKLGALRARLDDEDITHEALDLCESIQGTGMRWLEGLAWNLYGAALGRTADRLAYTVLARAQVALETHPSWRHLPSLSQGHLDLHLGHRDAAMARLSQVPFEALSSVQVRLALGSLRRDLQPA